jgi:hypothetical protein
MENIKELFAEWGLWSLVEDISDDGDGTGDNLQLTKEGSEAQRMIERELDKAKIEVLTEIFQTCYQEDSKTLELVEEKLAKLKDKK